MAPFKDQIDAALAATLATELERAWPELPRRRFLRGVGAALDPLELMARVDLLADRLAAVLPAGLSGAAPVLWRALESPAFTGWMTLVCSTYIARHGTDEPETALPLLAGLTPRWSSEFAIRRFIEGHPGVTYQHLRRWTSDPDEHVRRLVSEGTRPRLPWAPVLRALVEDPTPNLSLLDVLVTDPSPYVRRSVANHLNDISKDHPALALDLAGDWMARGDHAAAVVRHGLRTLVKRGDGGALELLGASPTAEIELRSFAVEPTAVTIGEVVTLRAELALPAAATVAVEAIVDYRVHYVGARGPKAPKVFKLTRRRLRPGVVEVIERSHRFEHVSIRTILPGTHTIDLQVNGRVLVSTTVEVRRRGAPASRDRARQ